MFTPIIACKPNVNPATLTPAAYQLTEEELTELRRLDAAAGPWDNFGDCTEGPRKMLWSLGLVYYSEGTYVTSDGPAVANA